MNNNKQQSNATKQVPLIPDPSPGAPRDTREVLGDPGVGEGGGGGRRSSTRRNGHARDAAGEPRIPDLPPGAPHDAREVLGDPDGGEGGGGGRRWMRDGTRRGSRRKEETGWMGVRGTEGRTRRNIEKGKMGESGEESRTGQARYAAGEDIKEGAREEGKKVWRPWKSSDLEDAVSQLRHSVIGAHSGTVKRRISLDIVPSSNLHHFVTPEPHKHECFPATDIRMKSRTVSGNNFIASYYRRAF